MERGAIGINLHSTKVRLKALSKQCTEKRLKNLHSTKVRLKEVGAKL